jgi:hypothetical protein
MTGNATMFEPKFAECVVQTLRIFCRVITYFIQWASLFSNAIARGVFIDCVSLYLNKRNRRQRQKRLGSEIHSHIKEYRITLRLCEACELQQNFQLWEQTLCSHLPHWCRLIHWKSEVRFIAFKLRLPPNVFHVVASVCLLLKNE